MRTLSCLVALLLTLTLPTLADAGSRDAGDRCASGMVGREFDGLVLCVPADNDRYRLTQDGLDWMAWRGDDPVARPTQGSSSGGADELEMTLARAWIGEAIVGAADSASGKNGFDRFMNLIAASVLQGAGGPDAANGFAAQVPVDESGLIERFQFRYRTPDLLEGERADKDVSGPDFILFRPSSGQDQPHILICSGGTSIQNPTHVCMSMRTMAGHRVGIMVTGTELERSFRISEQVGTDLESFVVQPAQ
ncbi:MAG: hypothetical protein R3D05_19885 [Dongiaceae bacterium]